MSQRDIRVCRTVQHRDFHLLFQPIVALGSGSIYGYEALTRSPAWPGEPQKLFEAAAKSGLLTELEMEVCRKAVSSALRWFCGEERLFVNLLPESFVGGEVMEVLSAYKGGGVVVEVTECQKVSPRDFEQSAVRWRKRGFSVSVDDVSAGHSRLMAVASLKPDYIKADRPLVAGAVLSPSWRAVLQHIVSLSQEIGAVVIAEGIETEEEKALVEGLGIGLGQGYLFGRPGPLAEFHKGRRKVLGAIEGGCRNQGLFL